MFHVSEVVNNNKNHRIFRQVSYESAGEGFTPQDGDRVFFGYQSISGRKDIVAAASYTRADPTVSQSTEDFQSNYNHVLTYIFVKSRYQGHGYGKKLLSYVERNMQKYCKRPVHTESSYKAVNFFKKYGYRVVGEPKDCVCAGSSRFSVLYCMEKVL